MCYCFIIHVYTFRNKGYLHVLKEPLGLLGETWGSLEGAGCFGIRKGSLVYPTGPEGAFVVIVL